VPLIEDMRAYGLQWLFDDDCEPASAEGAPLPDLEPAIAGV